MGIPIVNRHFRGYPRSAVFIVNKRHTPEICMMLKGITFSTATTFCMITCSIFATEVNHKHVSLRRTYFELMTSFRFGEICSGNNVILHLVKSLDDWSFSKDQLLSATFPIETKKSNYVRRDLRNVLFSKVLPTPFTSPVKLAIFSQDTLESILSMDEDITKSKEFVDFVCGNQVLGGVVPLAHRYGGHQFGSWADQLGDGRFATTILYMLI